MADSAHLRFAAVVLAPFVLAADSEGYKNNLKQGLIDAGEDGENVETRLNLRGEPLQLCDRPGYFNGWPQGADQHFPDTGYLQDNLCGSATEDSGSHYVCVQLPRDATQKMEVYSSFWTRTKQAKNAQEASKKFPRPGPWCICMWAFARMLGHDPHFVLEIDCKASNYWVVQNYDLSNPNECKALEAICSRCDLPRRSIREGIRKKCEMTSWLCPARADPEKCTAQHGCVA